jgi:hypothetical protein
MPSVKNVENFIDSQKSIQFYENVRKALKDVLVKLPPKDFEQATHNLILMVLHEGGIAQVMHFRKSPKFKIFQLTIPRKIPLSVLRYIIAHEFGHIIQGRNWKEEDGMNLEYDAEEFTKILGFPRTKKIDKWIKNYRKSFRLTY